MVAMGEGSGNTMGWSVELCGGSMCAARRHRPYFRRVRLRRRFGRPPHRGAHGTVARKAAHNAVQLVKAASSELNVTLEDCRRVSRNCWTSARSSRELSDAKKKLAYGRRSTGRRQRRGSQHRRHQNFGRAVSGIDIKDLKSLADRGQKQVGSGVVAIVAVTDEGKAASWSASRQTL